MSSLVSLIMPCYNASQFLDEMLSSVQLQTHKNIELICVDDASTDDTLNKLIKWKETFSNQGYELTVVSRKENGGVSSAINEGLSLFKGEFVCFPDADDGLEAGYVERMLDYLRLNPDINYVRCAYRQERGSVRKHDFGVIQRDNHDVLRDSAFCRTLAHRHCTSVWNMMARASYLWECIPSMKIHENRLAYQEWQLLLPLTHKSEYGVIPDILYNYKRRSSGQFKKNMSNYTRSINFVNENRRAYSETYKSIALTDKELDMCEKTESALFLGMVYETALSFSKSADSHIRKLKGLLQENDISCESKYLRSCFFPLLECILDKILHSKNDENEDLMCYTRFVEAKKYIIYGTGRYYARYAPALEEAFGRAKTVWDKYAGDGLSPPANIPVEYIDLPIALLIFDEGDAQQALHDLKKMGCSSIFTLGQVQSALRYFLKLI